MRRGTKTRHTLRAISLCSGVGGLDLAAHWGGEMAGGAIETVLLCEADAYCREILALRFAGVPIVEDIRDVSRERLTERGIDPDSIDLVFGGIPCFVAGTVILTLRGYIPIEQVQVGDEVRQHLGRWRKVTHVMSRPDANLRRVRACGINVITTDEHPFYARLREFSWDNANRKKVRSFADASWVDAEKLTTDHFLAQVLPDIQPDEHSTEFWWVIGRYLADGWRAKRPNRPVGRVAICAGYHKADDLQRRIAAAGFHATRSDERTGVKFYICNASLYHFLAQFGQYAHGKLVPGWVFSLGTEQSRALLDGYLSGDGNERSAETRALTTSKALALSIALLAQRAYGVVASIQQTSPKPTTVVEGRVVNQKPYYTVSVPHSNKSAIVEGAYGWRAVKRNEPCGVGSVYNLTVDEDNSYVADGYVVHNCQGNSAAGKRRGRADPRNLWPETKRILRELEPRYAVVENVDGLRSVGVGDDGEPAGLFGEILRDLAALGYRTGWLVLGAADAGAPHQRDRICIIGYRVADANQHGGRRQERAIA